MKVLRADISGDLERLSVGVMLLGGCSQRRREEGDVWSEWVDFAGFME